MDTHASSSATPRRALALPATVPPAVAAALERAASAGLTLNSATRSPATSWHERPAPIRTQIPDWQWPYACHYWGHVFTMGATRCTACGLPYELESIALAIA